MFSKKRTFCILISLLFLAIALLPQASAANEPVPVKVSYPYVLDITAVDFSPDEQFLVAGDGYGEVWIWDLENEKDIYDPNNVLEKERLMTLLGEHSQTHVYSAKFSPNGKYVLTGGSLFDFESSTVNHQERIDSGIPVSEVYLWNLETGQHLEHYMKNNLVMSVAFSPDGMNYAASYRNDISNGTNIVKIWSISSQTTISSTEIASLESYNDEVSSLVFTPDGQYLAVNYYNDEKSSSTILWDIENETPVFMINTGSLVDIDFSDDGSIFAGRSGSTNSIKIYNSTNWNLRNEFKDRDMRSDFVAYDLSPDGKYVAVVYRSHVLIWDIDTEEKIADFALAFRVDRYDCVSFSSNMTYLATGGDISSKSEYYESAKKAYSNSYKSGIDFEVYGSMLNSDAVFLWDFQDIKENEYIEDTLDTLFYITRIAFVVTSIMVLFIILFVAPKRRKKLEE